MSIPFIEERLEALDQVVLPQDRARLLLLAEARHITGFFTHLEYVKLAP